MTKSPRHSTVAHRIFTRLLALLPAGWHLRKEAPVELPAGPAGDSAPEPDVAVVRGTNEDYGNHHPGPDDTRLVVEVAADARAVARDRRGLARDAWAGIPTAWIVNLAEETIEVYTEPSGPVHPPAMAEARSRAATRL
ncbi:MAG: Uma2 family endonuclease [Isosphaeraceae bacterium]|nr:Uma2 family endonuclease [Isosphaeraceae bacterium]